ncbi:MAG: hypothetical protein WA208_01400 [Thermoanaerobaculia bacterium]
MASTRWERTVPVALLAVLSLLSVAPVRSYDLFWHLATGRWIFEHRALPATDPFALASAPVQWINGEWLFQLIAFGAEQIGGLDALSWMRALVVGSIFAIGAGFAIRRSDLASTVAVCCVCWAGAAVTLDARPSAFGALLTVLAIVLAERRSAWAYLILTVVWINIHPSALIAPVIAVLLSRRIAVVGASVAGLLINPYGLRGVIAPLELTSLVSSGEFVNAEWLPSSIARFPLLYVAIAVAFVVIAKTDLPRQHVWRFLLLALFAFLAVRHVRNQNLFFATFPLLVMPAFPRLDTRWRVVAGGVAAAALVVAAVTSPHGAGIPQGRFPAGSVAVLRAENLAGNIYNADQFGGYLIWSLYPERRVLTDGRNELHRAFITELGRALANEREWRALLAKYRIDLAVEEMRPPIPIVDAKTGQVRSSPASLAYWPRAEWALIGYDGTSMLFARRSAFSAATIERLEMRGFVPDR